MSHRPQRITLIARQDNKPDLDWNYTHSRLENVVFLDSVNALKFAVRSMNTPGGMDIERIIVDRAGNAEEFLGLLAAVPPELAGDILFIHDNRAGFLSASARGGDRVIYALTYRDIRFYLETFDLVTGRAPLSLTA